MVMDPNLVQLLEKAAARKKLALGKLISIFENQRSEAAQKRIDILKYIAAHPEQYPTRGFIVGITGTPGAGKSTLLGELALSITNLLPDTSIAVIAVDPSSQISGGAFLGDRTRVHFPAGDDRFFFRSQASNCEFGGVSFNTFNVVRLLRHFFDFIFIETVGIGQTEIEIQHIAHHTCLVMQPLAGDQVQFMKAGIMEMPDTFIINKCDEEALAQQSYHLLKASLKQAHLVDGDNRDIFLVSALKKIGIENFAGNIIKWSAAEESKDFSLQEQFYLHKWVAEEFGRRGVEVLKKQMDAVGKKDKIFEEKQRMLEVSISLVNK